MNNSTKDIRGYNDKVFKAIFSTEKGKILLKKLLKDILGRNINNITFISKEIPVNKISQKAETLDLLIDNKEERIDIEVNSCFDTVVIFRNLLYFFNIINQDQEEGKTYKTNKNYVLISLTRGLSQTFDVINEVNLTLGEKEYCKNVQIYEVNLDKALKLCYEGDNRDFVRHIGALSMETNELKKFKEDDEFMDEIDRELQRLKANGCVVRDDTEKLLRSVKEVNFQEGIEIGEAKGITKGIKIGEVKGKTDGIESIIKNMLKKGMTAKNIINITDVDKVIVEKVAKELANN